MPLHDKDFSSHDLNVLKQNSSHIKRFINKPGPRLCHSSVIYMIPELTGTVGEPVVLNLRKNRTRELPTESS